MKIVTAILIVAIALNGFALAASAQSGCISLGTGLTPPFPAGAFNCYYIMYTFNSYTCMFYTCPPPPEGACHACSGGKPIDLLTGDTFITENDIKVPGLSNGLTLTRTWNSIWPTNQTASQVGIFGPNWRSTYEERVFVGGDNYVKYVRADGSFWSFAGVGSLYLVSPSNVSATLTVDSGLTQWTLAFQNGEKRIFSYASNSLIAIIDRNGNTTTVSHDAINRITTVTDPGGRHLYFNYASGSSYLVTSVTSDIGISLSYAYDTQGRLTQVTEPDSTTLSFQYASSSSPLITAVLDSDGNVLESHTYDSYGRGLTSSRAGGAEAITVSYPTQPSQSYEVP